MRFRRPSPSTAHRVPPRPAPSHGATFPVNLGAFCIEPAHVLVPGPRMCSEYPVSRRMHGTPRYSAPPHRAQLSMYIRTDWFSFSARSLPGVPVFGYLPLLSSPQSVQRHREEKVHYLAERENKEQQIRQEHMRADDRIMGAAQELTWIRER